MVRPGAECFAEQWRSYNLAKCCHLIYWPFTYNWWCSNHIRCSIQCHTMGSITSPDALASGNCAYRNSKDENRPQIINTSIWGCNFGTWIWRFNDAWLFQCYKRCSCTSQIKCQQRQSILRNAYCIQDLLLTSSSIRATHFWWSDISSNFASFINCSSTSCYIPGFAFAICV